MAGAARRLTLLPIVAGFSALLSAVAVAEIGFAPIDLQVTRIETFDLAGADTRFGALEFRGGLEIASPDSDFGSLSGIDFAPDGTLFAVSDTGFWVTAHPKESDGRLVGLADARIAPILDRDGKPVDGKWRGDAEGLRITMRDGHLQALVTFEQVNDLRRFIASPDFAHARPESVRLPKALNGIERNAGLEAVAIAPAGDPLSGALVLIAERSLDRNGNHRGWIVGGPRRGAFSLTRSDDFDITDAAFLSSGDLLVLERRFTLLGGLGMRIRRVAAAELAPGETAAGRILIEADMRFEVDNMEGMALRTGGKGETLITLCSDDNDSSLQRTILLQFALPADAPPLPVRRPETH